MGYLSGSTGYVKVGTAAYSFGKWRFQMRSGAPKVTNFTTGGFQTVVPGVVAGTLTASGPINAGNMPLAVNGLYVFHLGLDTGVELSATCLVTEITPENDVDGAPQVSITAESSGAFTAGIM